MGVSWVYGLNKDQLIATLEKHKIPTEGNFAILRQKLVKFVKENRTLFKDMPADPEAYDEDADRTRDLEQLDELLENARHPPGGSSTPQRNFIEPFDRYDTVLDKMRKWNCHFDGRDLYAFLERLHELQRAYQFSDQQILQGFPELLRGDALLWFRNCESECHTLAQLEDNLRQFYLSPSELRHLDKQINDRTQNRNESIRSFTTALATLMRRRGGYSRERQLDTLYYNMKAELRLHIKRAELKDSGDLIQKVEEYEEIKTEINRENRGFQNFKNQNSYRTYNQTSSKVVFTPEKKYSPPTKSTVSSVEPAYDRSKNCWRCKQIGHNRFQCKNVQRVFCSFCGSDGILSQECNCHNSGNAYRADSTRTSSRPTPNNPSESKTSWRQRTESSRR